MPGVEGLMDTFVEEDLDLEELYNLPDDGITHTICPACYPPGTLVVMSLCLEEEMTIDSVVATPVNCQPCIDLDQCPQCGAWLAPL